MRRSVPDAPVAASALLAATLAMAMLDYAYGSVIWPHSLAEGGKRASGPVVVAAIEVARIFATAAILWLGVRWAFRFPVSGAEAIWMTLPYAVALFVFELLQLATVIVAVITGVQLYGPFFMIGYVGTLLVLIASAKVLIHDRGDWLTALPLGMAAAIGGYYVPPIVLPVAALYLIARRFT
ncbi:MAG: hypothetical protein AAF390_02020 [Pseudomonadota bacterium]